MKGWMAPVFLGGLSGTGKTQLRMALGAHPALSLTRHTALWDRYFGRYGDLREPGALDRCLAAIERDGAVAVLGPQPDRLRDAFAEGPATYARLFGLVHAHHAERVGARRWGEQLRSIERYADAIFDSFADGRVIHLVRDPRARVEPGRQLPRRLGWEAARWRASWRLAERNCERHSGRYLVLRFETLAADPAGTVADVLRFIGEPRDPAVDRAASALTFSAAGVEDRGASDRRIVDRFLEGYAGTELERSGYAAGALDLTARERVVCAVDWPVERAATALFRVIQRHEAIGARG